MKNREWLRRLPMDLLMDIVGGLIYAVGLNCFANPNDIAPGGMSGVAVILNYLFEIPMGITIFCVNIPLLLLAWRFLGHEFTLHSLKTILVWSVLVDVVKDGESIPAKVVYVRNRNKRKEYLCLICTDTTLDENEIIRIYGKRWDIEVFFKVCKSY